MPRVLIPETAKPYVSTDGRPVVTGGSKKAIFETLPNLLKLGEAIGGSQAVGAITNLGEDILSNLSGMGGAIEQRKLQEAAALARQPAQAPSLDSATGAAAYRGAFATNVKEGLSQMASANLPALGQRAPLSAMPFNDTKMLEADEEAALADELQTSMLRRKGKRVTPNDLVRQRAVLRRLNALNPAEYGPVPSEEELAGGTAPAPAAPAPVVEVDDSGEQSTAPAPAAAQPVVKPLRAADLPKQTNEGVPPTEETEFYSVTRGLPPIPAPGAAPTTAPAEEQLVVPQSREEVFAAAALADTPAKQAAVLQGAQNLFRPRTLFERMSGDHVARGMAEIKKLFPKMSDTLPRERFEYQQKRALTQDEQKAAALQQQRDNLKQRAENAIAQADQRRAEFAFESGGKFAETKRHNLAMEAAAWRAANAAKQRSLEGLNSTDLERIAKNADDALEALDKLDRAEDEKVAKAQKETAEARAEAAAAKRSAASAVDPATLPESARAAAAPVYRAAKDAERKAVQELRKKEAGEAQVIKAANASKESRRKEKGEKAAISEAWRDRQVKQLNARTGGK